MIERVYEVKLITPLIMAGSNPKEPEIRTQAIKGVIRWWYRFWKVLEIRNLKELKRVENSIFGSTDIASKIKLGISKKEDEPWRAVITLKREEEEECYLRMNDKPYTRKGFKAGISFLLKISFGTENAIEEVERTLAFISSFGGLGARWRRGFGSVEIYKNGVPLNFDLDNIKVRGISHKDLKTFPNLGSVNFWEIWPSQGDWTNWRDAMNSIRDKFYRPLKKLLGLRGIGSANSRCASPLIISIKEKENRFYGVVLVHRYVEAWEKSDHYQDKSDPQKEKFEKFITDFDLSYLSFQDVTLKKLR